MSSSTFRVRTVPLALSVDVSTSVKVTNLGPDTVTYRASAEGANLGTIAVGSSATFVATRWFFAAGNANLRSEVVDVESDSVVDPSTGKLDESRVPDSVASKDQAVTNVTVLANRAAKLVVS